MQYPQACKKKQSLLHALRVLKKKKLQTKQGLQHPSQKKYGHQAHKKGKQARVHQARVVNVKSHPALLWQKPLNQLLHLLLRATLKKMAHPRMWLCFQTQLDVCTVPCNLQVIPFLSNCKINIPSYETSFVIDEVKVKVFLQNLQLPATSKFMHYPKNCKGKWIEHASLILPS